jgi:putative transposase
MHIKVIGLENLDQDSTEYREFKQIIERLNRTYRQHVRPLMGFNSNKGAIALSSLFITHYYFKTPSFAVFQTSPKSA